YQGHQRRGAHSASGILDRSRTGCVARRIFDLALETQTADGGSTGHPVAHTVGSGARGASTVARTESTCRTVLYPVIRHRASVPGRAISSARARTYHGRVFARDVPGKPVGAEAQGSIGEISGGIRSGEICEAPSRRIRPQSGLRSRGEIRERDRATGGTG